MILKQCLNCHIPFRTYRNEQLYCSNKCRGIHCKPSMIGKKHTLAAKIKISSNGKGLKRSFSTKQKLSLSKIGDKNPSKQIWVREKLSKSRKGKSPYNKGIPMTLKQRKKLSIIQGSKKGFITPINKSIRNSFEYRNWRKAIFMRDNFICQMCNKRGVKLNADHIIPLSFIIQKVKFELGIEGLSDKVKKYPLFNDLNNGRTLCLECHRQTDTYQNNLLNTKYGKYKNNLAE